jgi:hypothetical protein
VKPLFLQSLQLLGGLFEYPVLDESPLQVGGRIALLLQDDRLGRQQLPGLDHQQPRGDHEEVGQQLRVQPRNRSHPDQVLVCHFGQADLGYRKASLLDQLQQQGQRPVEGRSCQLNVDDRPGPRSGRGG